MVTLRHVDWESALRTRETKQTYLPHTPQQHRCCTSSYADCIPGKQPQRWFVLFAFQSLWECTWAAKTSSVHRQVEPVPRFALSVECKWKKPLSLAQVACLRLSYAAKTKVLSNFVHKVCGVQRRSLWSSAECGIPKTIKSCKERSCLSWNLDLQLIKQQVAHVTEELLKVAKLKSGRCLCNWDAAPAKSAADVSVRLPARKLAKLLLMRFCQSWKKRESTFAVQGCETHQPSAL